MMRPLDVPGLVTAEAGAFLTARARLVPPELLIVEIGAFRGRSTCFLADGAKRGQGAKVLSIDPWDLAGNLPGRNGRFIARPNQADQDEHLRACGLRDQVTSLQGFSHSVPLPAEKIGLLWIDGAHDFENVSRDVARWAPLVAPGGAMIFDDVGTWHPGVDRVVKAIRQRSAEWAPIAVGVPKPLAGFLRR